MAAKTILGITLASAGLLFFGYCVYFDHKRRSDPLFKQKLQERRKKKKDRLIASSSLAKITLPKLDNPNEAQEFFLQEVQTGERLLQTGKLTDGVDHLAIAVALCAQPAHLMGALSQSLPAHIYRMLAEKVPMAKKILVEKCPNIAHLGGSSGSGPSMRTFPGSSGHMETGDTNMQIRELDEDDLE